MKNRGSRPSSRSAITGASCIALLVLSLASCSSDGQRGDVENATGNVKGGLTVLAASSLTEVFTDLSGAFEADYPGVRVNLSFAASPTLVAQVQEGAPADMVATADDLTMKRLIDSGDVMRSRAFARNKLAIAVARGNPLGIAGLRDLARKDIALVLCDSAVPCGRLADQALDQAGVSVSPESREQNVKATLGKVELGEADAAIVYVTDTAASDAVTAVSIPDDLEVTTSLPSATLRDATNSAAAAAFTEFLLSAEGRRILLKAGFLEP